MNKRVQSNKDTNSAPEKDSTLSVNKSKTRKKMSKDEEQPALQKTLTEMLFGVENKSLDVKLPSKTLEELGYYFNNELELRQKGNDEKFKFVDQAHYEFLGDAIVDFIQQKMMKDFKLKEVLLPLDEHVKDIKATINNIFMSEDALTNPNKLMLICCGSGAVRAGQWARSLCINDSLYKGTIFGYLARAQEQGYGVIVLNPNLNHHIEYQEVKKRVTRSNSKQDENAKEKVIIPIQYNETPQHHFLYVYEQFVTKSAAKNLFIVAHSFGGVSTINLLKEKAIEIFPRLKRIGFTDSVHSLRSVKLPSNVLEFLKENCRNWVQSEEELDTEFDIEYGCQSFSAGTKIHELTSFCCMDSLFKFFC